jgi:hypothetical protein
MVYAVEAVITPAPVPTERGRPDEAALQTGHHHQRPPHAPVDLVNRPASKAYRQLQ